MSNISDLKTVSNSSDTKSAQKSSINYNLTQAMANTDLKSDELKTKPIEMNTFVQLEIDNNNHACIPRVCRFCITKLSIQQNESTPIVLAVKLDASKRSLRTVDIPLQADALKTPIDELNLDQYYNADLNLHYTVTYPHFLKKDTNFLYFYIQKRKKLKNRAILGFKTLAIGFVDLNSILQKSFSSELPLYFTTTSQINNNNSNNFSSLVNTNQQNNNTNNNTPNSTNQNSNNKTQQKIIGTLKIKSLTSLPFESLDVDSAFSNVYKNATENVKNESEEIEDEDDLNKMMHLSKNESFHFENNNNKDENRVIAESDNENDMKKKEFDKSLNTKNFTGKILSFIKRFRNENSNNLLEEELANETNIDDFDIDDNIDQISDYTDSDAEPDAYSIVSELKPKLQPFFSNNPK